MLNISENIKVIEELVSNNTPASLTYAALECRLTIEQLCYERLRMAHDYISHDDLSKWQPKDVVKTLIQEVDASIASDVTYSIAKSRIQDESKPLDEYEYLEVGRQIGFNANLMGKLWNALANVALHIPVPESKDVILSRYGDVKKVRKKINQCLVEFRELSKSTMVLSGFGDEVSFDCFGCGNVNKRRMETLDHKQIVNCIDPNCSESYEVEKINEDVLFERRKVTFPCDCDNVLALTHNDVGRMKLNEILSVVCSKCNGENFIRWGLCRTTKNLTPKR